MDEITYYIIGAIIFTLITLAGINIMLDVSTKDSSFVEDEKFENFNSTFNNYEEIVGSLGGLGSAVGETDPEEEGWGLQDSLIAKVWNTIKLIPTTFNFMGEMFMGFCTFFGVPTWVGVLLSLILTVLLAFAIYKVIFRL